MKATATQAVSPAPVVKTNHGDIKAKMLAVLATVLDIQTSYEAYERPSEVNEAVLFPLWQSRIEAAGAISVTINTTPAAKQSWKYVLEVGFTLQIGENKYKLQAIGADAPKGYNSTAEWIRDVKRWPDSEKAMEKKEAKGFHFPASNPKPNQATFDALQDACIKNLEDRLVYMLESAAKAFDGCKFDGRPTYGINVHHNGYSLHFANKTQVGEQSATLTGGLKEFEEKWIPRFDNDAIALQVFRNRINQAAWTRKWIDGEIELIDNKKPSERYAEVLNRWQPEKQIVVERAEIVEPVQQECTTKKPSAVVLTASYYRNPKTGLTKSFLVKGDTALVKDQLKEMNGTWCAGLGGWIFGLKREHQFKTAFPQAQWIAEGSIQMRAA